ncbi:unnamed protein product [Phytomonas sp. Hart1]|nr:unnamed protein product [Phytomonas sp. Hart1]|eukprot:CCW68104.1 unnamed protein product [Phytomonas sp. isolate Hart1]
MTPSSTEREVISRAIELPIVVLKRGPFLSSIAIRSALEYNDCEQKLAQRKEVQKTVELCSKECSLSKGQRVT